MTKICDVAPFITNLLSYIIIMIVINEGQLMLGKWAGTVALLADFFLYILVFIVIVLLYIDLIE